MNGYIKKQALMDYCSNQVTRTIDLNDIARFPISEVFTKNEVIAMLTEILLEIEQCGVEDSHWIIKEKINALKVEHEL